MNRYLVILGDNAYRTRIQRQTKIFGQGLNERNVTVHYQVVNGQYPILELYDYDANLIWDGNYHLRSFRQILGVIDSLSTRPNDNKIRADHFHSKNI